MSDHATILGIFPNLDPAFIITSPRDPCYNCIAWAAGDEKNKWWPAYGAVWPVPKPPLPSVDAFVEAFRTLGFAPVSDDSFEIGVTKIAIYVNQFGFVTHMARQLPEGVWTSKLGDEWDISHPRTTCLNGVEYGSYHSCVGRLLTSS